MCVLCTSTIAITDGVTHNGADMTAKNRPCLIPTGKLANTELLPVAR